MKQTTPWHRAAEAHRVSQRDARRAVLVDAAVTAIERNGPDVSVAEIARVAGVTKPVLYRQFADKDDLMRAVGVAEGERILVAIQEELRKPGSPTEAVTRSVDAFLQVIAEHPRVYLALLRQRPGDEMRLTQQGITDFLHRLIREAFVAAGIDAAGAEVWTHCIVSMGVAAGELYLSGPRKARARISAQVTEFIVGGLAGITASAGVDLEVVARGVGQAIQGADRAGVTE